MRKNLVIKFSVKQLLICGTLILSAPINLYSAESENQRFIQDMHLIAKEFDLCKRMNMIVTTLKESSKYERYVLLPIAAKTAYKVEQFGFAKQFSEELLALSKEFPDDWNYGNAIHDSYMVIGLLKLQAGNVEGAELKLLEAGATPGSPQINSFGPNMMLAEELIELNKDEVVIEYLEMLKKSWGRNNGKIDSWISAIKGDGKPHFGSNLEY